MGTNERRNRCDTLLWDELKKHRGHHIRIASYGISLECEDCNEVILDAELYTICGREDV